MFTDQTALHVPLNNDERSDRDVRHHRYIVDHVNLAARGSGLIVASMLALSACAGHAAESDGRPQQFVQPGGVAQTEDESPHQVFQHRRVVETWSLDGDRFSVGPAETKPRIPARQAAVVLAASELGATMPERVLFGFGRVTIDPKVADDGTPTFRHRDSWVAVASGFVHSCPAITATPSPRSNPHPDYRVLVLDGRTGAAGIVYTSAQSLCGGPLQPPHAFPLVENLALPWTLLHRTKGGAVVRTQVPTCARDATGRGIGHDGSTTEQWQIVAQRYLTGRRCLAKTTETTRITIRYLSPHTEQLTHGPVGPEPPPATDTTGGQIERLAGVATAEAD